MQKDIILSVLNGKDTLALLPTGGGKSICFQIPGLALSGTTLVVSPLVALMNDQVENLKKRGISAVAISAAMSYKQIQIAMNNAVMGHVQFIYVSPERLQNETFQKQISYLPITLIAVDEAHCISQWGYDFRPSYLNIAELRTYFEKVPIIALTASATKEVASDIQFQLRFKERNVFRQSFERKNLRYVVQLEEDKEYRLMKLIRNLGGSGIVYVRNRKKTEDVSKFLLSNNISSQPYHAGMKYHERETVQENWIKNKTQVIVATNAFGMGIDKPDVRFVVHLDLPESIEAYFQEAGRAGRDGNTAYSSIFYNNADVKRLWDNFELSFPTLEEIRNMYNAVFNYYQMAMNTGEDQTIDLDIEAICNSYHLNAVTFYNSLKFLEKQGYFSIYDSGYEPSKLMVLASKETLYDFQIKNPKYEPLIKSVLRSYTGLFEQFVYINEKDLVYKVKLSYPELIQQLELLSKHEIWTYIPTSNLPKLTFLQNRMPHKLITLDPENYKVLKENQEYRIKALVDYLEDDQTCRQLKLLSYFNEFANSNCGYCDVCLSVKTPNTDLCKKKLIEFIKEKPRTILELKEEMIDFNLKTWTKTLGELVESEQLLFDDYHYRVKG